MRKLFKSVFAAVCAVSVAVGFTACENGEEEPFDNKYNAAGLYYPYMEENGTDANMYVISLNEKGIEATNRGMVTGGSGVGVSLYFFSTSKGEPAQGEYVISESASPKSCEDMKMMAGSDSPFEGTYVVNVVDGAVSMEDGVLAMCEEGECTMNLSKNKKGEWVVKATITMIGGEVKEYEYRGPIRFYNELQSDFQDESEKAPGEFTFEEAVGTQGQMGGKNAWLLQFVNGDATVYVNMMLYSSSKDIKELYGKTYPIDGTEKNNTVLASSGMVQGEPTMSIVYTDCSELDEQGRFTYGGMYYIVSGELTIDADGKVALNAKSYRGFDIKGKSTVELLPLE